MLGRSKRKRSQRDSCTICGHSFPLATHYDAESYEKLVLNHMMKCSASQPVQAAAAQAPPRKLPMQKRKTPTKTNDRKSGAATPSETFSGPQTSAIGVKPSPTCFVEEKYLAVCDTSNKPTNIPQNIVFPASSSNSVASSEASPLKTMPSKKLKRSPSLQMSDDTTAETDSTTKESSTTTMSSVASTHFLAQTWWREKTIQKTTGVSVPFSLESCVTSVAAAESNLKPNNADESAGEQRQLRNRSRRKPDSLEMACPVCRKSFHSILPFLTEDAMSRHVDRCSRKLLSEKVPRSKTADSSSATNGSKKVNMASNLAFAAALSRPRNQQAKRLSESEREKAENDRQARRAAELDAHNASMHFLTYGAGEQALNDWILGKRDDS